ncbi:trehalose-phosphatase [Microbacterium paulum]
MSDDEALAALARTPRLLVALDFDGTLSPLVDEPMAARMLPAARDAVAALVAAPDTTVALVSGRSLPDLRVIAEHDDDSPILLVGSHGAEHWVPGAGELPRTDDAAALALRDRLRAEAEDLVADIPGAWIEPKTFGFAVPTRTVAPSERAGVEASVDALVAARAPQWRRRTGHHIVEYAFRSEGKDAGVAWLRERTGATAVLFAGDDVTDEDALRALRPGDLGVRVGAGETAAKIRVDDISELAALLVRLAHERGAARE